MSWSADFLSSEVGAGFEILSLGGARVALRRGYRDALDTAGVLRGEEQAVAHTAGGRERHAIVELGSGDRVLVRKYRRGGFIRRFNRDRYFLGHRALEELRITELAARAGVNVPVVVAAREEPRGIGYTALLVLVWIDGAVDLATWLTTMGRHSHRGVGAPGDVRFDGHDERAPLALSTSEDSRDVASVLAAAGAQIGRLHGAGITHPDINLRNILVAASPSVAPIVYLIDFDRARTFRGPVPVARRRRDLRRLERSARKLGVRWGEAERAAMRNGYGAGWPFTD